MVLWVAHSFRESSGVLVSAHQPALQIEKPWCLNFATFCGVNTPILSDFKLPTWCQPGCKIPEYWTIGSFELEQPSSTHHWGDDRGRVARFRKWKYSQYLGRMYTKQISVVSEFKFRQVSCILSGTPYVVCVRVCVCVCTRVKYKWGTLKTDFHIHSLPTISTTEALHVFGLFAFFPSLLFFIFFGFVREMLHQNFPNLCSALVRSLQGKKEVLRRTIKKFL